MLAAPLKPAHDVVHSTSELIRPPRRMRPSEAAALYLRTEKGAWDPNLTPEMIEPLDLLASREYTGIVFVGPARSGKTMSLLLAGISYVVTCAPGDMLVVHMSQDTARDFSRTDLDRAIRHSPELQQRLSPRPRDDNIFDKFWRSGVVLKLGWPAVSQVSAKTQRYVFVTDYDRPENRDDVDGEGPLWDLAAKRVETMMSRGKCLAESSPGEDCIDGQWKPSTPHEAPPVRGILSLYNRGTRARLFWPCQDCGTFFQAEPGLGNFALPAFDELLERVQTEDLAAMAESLARIVCKSCGALHDLEHRRAMKARATWVHEGQSIDAGGRAVGPRRRSQIASYWMGGVAAAYQRWDSILLKYLQALFTYARTKDESPLRATTNTDQAAPYAPRAAGVRRSADTFMQRREDWAKAHVPAGVRFLTAQVDVQAHRFVVEVRGWGAHLETWPVDRFDITASRRPEGERFAAIDPAAYSEDWDVLRDEVMARRYPLIADPSVTLGVHLMACDSGGKAGVTTNAYEFWRRLRRDGLHHGCILVKGAASRDAPIWAQSFPEQRADRRAGGKGDVPVWLLNTLVLKDTVVGELAREEPGPGFSHFPRWLDEDYFAELTAEVRGPKGWTKPPGARNEAFDLYVYGRAACLILGAQRIDWIKPPAWAADPLTRAEKKPEIAPTNLAALAAKLNG